MVADWVKVDFDNETSSQHHPSVPSVPSRILLASCNSQHHEPVLWDAMSQRNVSNMVWVGDAVYGDDFYPSSSTNVWWSKWRWMKQGAVRAATPTVLKGLYNELLANSGYRRFTRRTNETLVSEHDNEEAKNTGNTTIGSKYMTILGVWDDHDYGVNNGDRNYPFRTESAMLYLDFLKHSSSSSSESLDLHVMEQRAVSGRGLYGVKVLDFHRPIGHELLSDEEAGIEPVMLVHSTENGNTVRQLSNRSVAIFLVDCRSNKIPWKTSFPDRFLHDYDVIFLVMNSGSGLKNRYDVQLLPSI
jgi:hypothetical protein